MPRKRQAIVVIHGIGEQRPMSTLRGFVQSMIYDATHEERTLFFNKPDPFAGSFELRMLSVYPSKGRPRTDFFEYYWAYKMRGTKFSHVTSWLKRILVRSPFQIPKRIRWIWFVVFALILLFIAVIATGIIHFETLKLYSKTTIGVIIAYLFSNAMALYGLRYLGDAARYTNADPENIQERQEIRSNGIELLKKLHECGKYDQIKIVGHSLGSIIGYDIIKHLWSEYNTLHNNGSTVKQDRLKKFEKDFAHTNSPVNYCLRDIKEFQKRQNEVIDEQSELGNPWLVTDFITLGSPLTYSSILMADNLKDLVQRQTEREFPTSPPIAEKEGELTYPLNYTDTDGNPKTVHVLHHGAPFACTKWHNVYFENDYVGGPMKNIFGAGVQDYKLKLNKTIAGNIPFLSHTQYWSIPGEDDELVSDAITTIKEIVMPAYQRKQQ